MKSLLKTQRHEAFDLIVSHTALPYIEPDKMRALVVRQIYNSLKPGGFAALTVTNLLRSSNVDTLETYEDIEKVTAYLNRVFASRGLQILINQIPIRITDSEGIVQELYGECRILMKKNDRPFYFPIPYDIKGQQMDVHEWARILPAT